MNDKRNDPENTQEILGDFLPHGDEFVYTLTKLSSDEPSPIPPTALVTLWSDQVISFGHNVSLDERIAAEDAMQNLLDDMDNSDPDIMKGFAIRIVTEKNGEVHHVSMTQPIHKAPDDMKMSECLAVAFDGFAEQVEEQHSTEENREEFWENSRIEIIPVRGFLTSNWSRNHTAHSSTRARKVGFITDALGDNSDAADGLAVFRGGVGIRKNEAMNPKRMMADFDKWVVDFGPMTAGEEPVHASTLIPSTRGRAVQVSEQLQKAVVLPSSDPGSSTSPEGETEHGRGRTNTRLNVEDFNESLEAVAERNKEFLRMSGNNRLR